MYAVFRACFACRETFILCKIHRCFRSGLLTMLHMHKSFPLDDSLIQQQTPGSILPGACFSILCDYSSR